jgi:hypothetical protein
MKVYPKDNNRQKITAVYMREEQSGLEATREALLKEGVVKVINEYETFYGVSFDGWLRQGLKDLDCNIEVTSYNHWEGYPWNYTITLNK